MNAIINIAMLIADIFSFLFLFFASCFIIKIRSLTNGFKEVWNYILLGVLPVEIIMFILCFSFFKSSSYLIANPIFHVLLLATAISLCLGFYKLLGVFNNIGNKRSISSVSNPVSPKTIELYY